MPGTTSTTLPVRRRARWILGALVLVVAIAGFGWWFGTRVLEVRDLLLTARDDASAVTTHYRLQQPDDAVASLDDVAESLVRARRITDTVAWKAMGAIPVYGDDLRAVRLLVDQGDDLLTTARPMAGRVLTLDPSTLIADGRVDASTVTAIASDVPAVVDQLDRTSTLLTDLRSRHLLAQIAGPVQTVDEALSAYLPALRQAAAIAPHVGAMLGESTPRQYLVLVQNNAETRSLGGNPAAMMLIRVDDGVLSVVRQASSTSFSYGRAEPIANLPGEVTAVYPPNLLLYAQDSTGYPDFPTAARLAQAWWATIADDHVDAVVGFDPVGLSYLLEVTGPVTIPSGQELNAQNVVGFLLNGIYATYDDPVQQDAVFASAAASLFTTLTSRVAEPELMVQPLRRSIAEGRLLYYATDPGEQQSLSSIPELQGVTPADTAASSTVGVYFWNTDPTGSKADFFLTPTVAVTSHQCASTGTTTWTADVSLTTALTQAEATALPEYVLPGPTKLTGAIHTDVYVHGPQGSTLVGIEVPRASAGQAEVARGTIDGRPVARVTNDVAWGQTGTVRIVFTRAGAAGDTHVRTTPWVRPFTVTSTGVESCP